MVNMFLYEISESGLDITELDNDILLQIVMLY